MSPRFVALVRLLAVQASYTYERMLGIGVGHASAPLLRDAFVNRSVEERTAAIARSADFFNSHPYLAGVAVGAVVRVERDGVPGTVISRLRTALSGPLGSLGDQLIWAGWVPALVGLGLLTAPWLGIWSIVGIVVIHNLLRFSVTWWGLNLGLREGLGVGAALQRSWLPRAAEDAQRAAAFAVGLAVPIVASQQLLHVPRSSMAITLVVALTGIVLGILPATRTRASGLRFGMLVLAIALIVVGVTR